MGVKFSQLPAMTAPAADDYMAVLDTSDTVLKKMPISHASTASVFGLGSTSSYGHMKIVKDQNTSTVNNGEALSPKVANDIRNQLVTSSSIETGTKVASGHSYTAGQYFMWNRGASGDPLELFKCTAAMSSGDTISTSTNCTATSVSTALSELNSKYYNTTFGNQVNIAGYRSANPYTIPHDGYIGVYSRNENSHIVLALKTTTSNDIYYFSAANGMTAYQMWFVASGSQVYVHYDDSMGYILYTPITNR